MERGLGLCCEEAARLLLASDGPLTFTTEECNEPEDELDDDDREIRDEVLYAREQIFATLADNSLTFQEKLHNVFRYTDENPFAPLENAKAYLEHLAKTESFGPAWDEALARIKAKIDAVQDARALEDQGLFSETESTQLLAYLIYRHYAKCLFEGREQGKLLFALFFWNVARFFTKELGGKIGAIKILSRQLEYCEENMELIEKWLDDSTGIC
jgi:lysine-N-methylase